MEKKFLEIDKKINTIFNFVKTNNEILQILGGIQTEKENKEINKKLKKKVDKAEIFKNVTIPISDLNKSVNVFSAKGDIVNGNHATSRIQIMYINKCVD
jgi:hypothetical protein